MVQTILSILASLIILAVTALAARKGQTAFRGVLLGVIAGIATIMVLGFAGGFLANVLPLGQLEFWLASVIGKS
jgi:hypothetical protein